MVERGGRRVCYAVVEGGQVVGTSSFVVDAPNRAVEIGATYLHPHVRATGLNLRMKRVMLERAFAAGVRRAELKVDVLNERSRAAIEKLGAVFEGIRRQDRVTWTGRVRDTAYYSILADEWPAARDRIDAALARGHGRWTR